MTSDDLDGLIEQFQTASSGGDRLDQLTASIDRADAAGDARAGVRLRLERNLEHYHRGQLRPLIDAFAWVRERVDAGVELDELSTRMFLAQYAWVIEFSIWLPDIPLERIEEQIDDFATLLGRHGHSDEPAVSLRYVLAAHRQGAHGAQREFQTWLDAEPGDLSDCALCQAAARVEHFVAVGADEQALIEGYSALNSGEHCDHHPRHLLTMMLEALLRGDEPAVAARSHVQAWHQLRRHPRELHWMSVHLAGIARAGQIDRALRLLEETRVGLEAPVCPLWELAYCGRAALVLRLAEQCGWAERPLRGGTVAGVRSELSGRARELAMSFDERNGTDRWTQWLTELDGATGADFAPLPDFAPPLGRVDLDPDLPEDPTLRDAPPEVLAERIDAARSTGRTLDDWALVAEWRRRMSSVGDDWTRVPDVEPQLAGDLSSLVGARTPHLTAEGAIVWAERAADAYRAAGDEAQALIEEQRIAEIRGDDWRVREMVAEVDRIGTVTQRALVRLGVLRLGLPGEERERLLHELMDLPVAKDSDPRLRRAMLYATRSMDPEDPAENRLLAPEEAPAMRDFLRAIRTPIDADHVDIALARAETAIQTAVDAGDLHVESRSWLALAQMSVAAERIDDAEQALARCGQVESGVGGWAVVALSQRLLSTLLADEDRVEEAAEVAEAAVSEIDRARQRGPIWGHAERTEFDLLLDRAAAVAAELDDVERARELWERICDGEDAEPVLVVRCELHLGQLARAQDDAITAVQHFRRAADGAQELDLPGEWASAVLSLPYLVGATDGPDAAFAVLDDAGAVLDHISARVLSGEWADAMHPEALEHMRAEHEECRVRLLAGVGRFDEAVGAADELAGTWQRLERYPDEIGVRQLVVEFHVRMGRPDEAVTMAEALIARVRELGVGEELVHQLAADVSRRLHETDHQEAATRFWETYGPEE